ncbi:MAG: polysaccharide deacetylase family protein [Lachnospiraceae bacterium]|nr:polysaccharide deacetylase family protein [Lachnospiraceae bacterium]MBO4824201.1 polysaccharide deacetylase family protein [Lachnospiraceae bacterium]
MAELCMCYPGGLHKALTLSYDDGVEQDKKLIEIMVKYGLKGTFNLNSGIYAAEGTVYPEGTIHRRMPKSEIDKLYIQNGMEVATHGYTHPFLNRIPPHVATKEIMEDRRTLEEQFNCVVRGHAYPFGCFNDTVVDILKQCGIVYARTVRSTHWFNPPEDWLRLDPTCHHDDPKLFELCDMYLKMNGDWGYPQIFYLWGHAYEFEANNNWDRIEKFGELMGGHDDIWYATNIEIYNYLECCKQLRFTADVSLVENPTAIDIWFTYDNKPYMVKAGETLKIG